MMVFSSLRGSPMSASRSLRCSSRSRPRRGRSLSGPFAGRQRLRPVRIRQRRDVADLHPGRVPRVRRGRRVVEAVEVERRGTGVAQGVADLRDRQRRQVRGAQVDALGDPLQRDVVVDELPEVGVDGRDRRVAVGVGVTGLDRVHHRLPQRPQTRHGRRPLGQQVRRVVLQIGEQVVELAQVLRCGCRHRRPTGTRLPRLVADDLTVAHAHGLSSPEVVGSSWSRRAAPAARPQRSWTTPGRTRVMRYSDLSPQTGGARGRRVGPGGNALLDDDLTLLGRQRHAHAVVGVDRSHE